MTIRELTEKECRALLAGATIGRLGCCLNSQPYVVPVYFASEDDNIYIFSTFGRKIEWMRMNPRVCLQMDDITSQTQWVSVIASGTYEELAEPQHGVERAHAREVLEKHHRWWLNAIAERRTKVNELFIDPLFFTIHIDSLSGLRAIRDGEAAP